MKTRALISLLLLLLLGVVGAQAQATVPTCNAFDATGIIPVYVVPGSPVGTAGTTACTDYFGKANYANSPLPTGSIDTSVTGFTIQSGGSGYTGPIVSIDDYYGTPGVAPASCTAIVTAGAITGFTCGSAGSGYVAPVVNITDPTGTGAVVLAKLSPATVVAGTGIRKFVDTLPNLPLATPDTTTFLGSDYYVIALVQYSQQMHSDLPATTLRGYCQLIAPATTCVPSYLGPVILATKNRPVRVLFKNLLPSVNGIPSGNLFIPTDTTYMGAGVNPDGQPYLQNRATLHLHGGNTPWISDGTPHQWTAPAIDWQTPTTAPTNPAADNLNRGVSTRLVPDMWFDSIGGVVASCAGQMTCAVPGATNDPGPGNMTFYWTNQQGGRLMFYHDHAYGITRLNVYVGEAAGYLLTDPTEETALKAATLPGTVITDPATGAPVSADLAHLVPLVIQDKTFVPNANQLAAEDPTWLSVAGGGTIPGTANPGDLWYPHVYLPNQNPNDLSGANAFGRWDYGAWFFPPQTTLSAANPPTAVTIPCTSAAFPAQALDCPITPNPSGTPEGFMDTPLVNGKAYPVLHVAPEAYRFRFLSAGNDRTLNLSLYQAIDSTNALCVTPPAAPVAPATASCTEVRLAPGPAGIADMGLIPDQTTAGPPFYQIGTEGGLLPNVAVILPSPITYEYNRRSITVLNVLTHSLLLGPAERADAIVDFTGQGGKTFILYNDAPAPVPAFDTRIDYYTGDVDQVVTGGAPATLPGYGPNTRTIMQIIVDAPASSPAQPLFSLGTLQGALPALFAATQPKPIVPEPTYPVASGGNASIATYARISDNAISVPQAGTPLTSISLTAGGTGYTAPTVTIAPPTCVAPCATATATATVVNGVITAITLTSGGLGYTKAPLVTITDSGTGTGATATASLTTTYNYEQKAIQELFTLDYGRMNATLGTELPLTNFLVQTTLPFGYAEWATEIIKDGETQLWKLTHNGVDTHFVHFHLFNVQVINRIGWDGAVKPPDPNELGWKDTVRMNPLEDIVFALQPLQQNVPFPLPDSIRPLDVTMPAGVVSPAISGIDPASGNAIPGGNGTLNKEVNFGWEYVWHCHILGHEENDMMRPIIFQVAPPAPSNLVAGQSAQSVALSFTDNSASESGFDVQRDTVSTFDSPDFAQFTLPASTPVEAFGGTITATDNATNATLWYRVRATDDFTPMSPLALPFQVQPMSSAWSAPVQALPVTTTTITVQSPVVYGNPGTVTVNVASFAGAGIPTGKVTLTVNGVAQAPGTLDATGNAVFTLTGLAVGTYNLTAGYPGVAGSFSASTGTATLSVTPATLMITADSFTILYGTALPVFTFTASGFQYGDSAATAITTAPACSPTLPTGNPAGGWPINCSGAVVNANYTVAYVAGSLTISRLAASVTPNPATKVFGTADPAPLTTGTLVGFLPADNVTATYTRAAGEAVGSYTISATLSPTASLSNYNITSNTAQFTISPASLPVLTITANSATRVWGFANPAITFAYSGFLPGDTPANSLTPVNPVCTTTATNTSAVGTYPITCGGQTSTRYSLNYVPGTLTVTSAVQLAPGSLTFPAQSIGTTSTFQTVTLTNLGGSPMTFSIAINGNFLRGGNGGGTCGTTLNAGRSCAINVRFRPATSGPLTGTLTVNATAAGTGTVALSGTGLGAVAAIAPPTTAAAPYNFGGVIRGQVSAPLTINVTNMGSAPMTFNTTNGFVLGGNNPTQFTVTTGGLCVNGGTLGAGASCSVTVSFAPRAGTTRTLKSATVTVRSNAPVNPTLRLYVVGTAQ